MSEVEIRTPDEIIVNHEVVGTVTWHKPLSESEMSGTYMDAGHAQGLIDEAWDAAAWWESRVTRAIKIYEEIHKELTDQPKVKEKLKPLIDMLENGA